MIESCYVDDLAAGEDDTGRAFALYNGSKDRLAYGGFKLRKWMTNDEVFRGLPAQDENPKMANDGMTNEEETYAKLTLGSEISKSCPKVLGLPWGCKNDLISFSFEKIVAKAQDIRPTKRSLLSLLASTFDPLGIISPITACIKMLFQELCRDNVGWDDKQEKKATCLGVDIRRYKTQSCILNLVRIVRSQKV